MNNFSRLQIIIGECNHICFLYQSRMKKFGGEDLNFARFGGSSSEFRRFGGDRSSFKRFDNTNNDESNDNNEDQEFSQRAPILSTEYFGISTEKTRSSTDIIKSNTDMVVQSTENALSFSTKKFKSSDDILRYLRSHPDFRKMDEDNIPIIFNAIMAAIASGALLAGGIALTIITWGTASPVIMCSTSLLIGTGMTGLGNAILGAINHNFQWSDWGKGVIISSGLHLLTFGAGFGVGSLVGIALLGSNLSNNTIMAIGCVAGALTGSGVRTGSYLIVTKLEGKPISTIKIVLEGVSGAITGAMAGYVGVKAEMVKFTNNLHVKNVFKNGHFLYEYVKLDDAGHVGLIAGKHSAEHSGYGLVHILNQHPDVGQALGFTCAQIKQALSGNTSMLDSIANKFIELIKTTPYGILTKSILKQAEASIVWEIGGKYLKVGLAHFHTLGAKAVIQANLVNVEDVMRKTFSSPEIEELINIYLTIS